jgi:hypothetical protein
MASDIIFWGGKSRSDMVPLELPDSYTLGSAMLLANTRGPFRFNFVLVRNGNCLVLDSHLTFTKALDALPVWDGDAVFPFRGLEDLSGLNMPVIQGEKAIEALLEDEQKRREGKSFKYDASKLMNALNGLPRVKSGFWAGKSFKQLRLWTIMPWHVIRQGLELACIMKSRDSTAVLVRNGKCLLLPVKANGKAGAMPILPGDQYFAFQQKDELAALGLPVLEGQAAIEAILTGEQQPRNKSSK